MRVAAALETQVWQTGELGLLVGDTWGKCVIKFLCMAPCHTDALTDGRGILHTRVVSNAMQTKNIATRNPRLGEVVDDDTCAIAATTRQLPDTLKGNFRHYSLNGNIHLSRAPWTCAAALFEQLLKLCIVDAAVRAAADPAADDGSRNGSRTHLVLQIKRRNDDLNDNEASSH